MEIKAVSLIQVHQIWPDVSAFIASGLKHSNDYTIDQARAQLGLGYWHLIVAEEGGEVRGAAAIEFINKANHRVAFIVSIGGRLILSEAHQIQFEKILKGCGATSIECACRPSASRLFSKWGMAEKYSILEKVL